MVIVLIVGSLPAERLRNKKRKLKAQCCRKQAAEIKALFLPAKSPNQAGLGFTPQRKAKTKQYHLTLQKIKTLPLI